MIVCLNDVSSDAAEFSIDYRVIALVGDVLQILPRVVRSG